MSTLLCSLLCRTHNCVRLLTVPLLYSDCKAALKSTKVKLHGNNAYDVIIVHVNKCRCTDQQTDKQMRKMLSNLRTSRANTLHEADW